MEQKDFIQGKELAIAAASLAIDNKAKEIKVLDLQGISSIADYFVICTGESIPHLRAISREIGKSIIDEHHVRARNLEGTPESLWMVIDYIDVVVHVFHKDLRSNYGLEDLWSDAALVSFEDELKD
ncbi:MAG: ribosome silencing factor [Verrucomicrobiales bacterium]|nr:MAG: ribosome silencing factor [Verrucomicrobiaceae bacterium]|tara:strand:- start:57 stop:434 length:378 start_codon:yes stop_codon:yes gene_type:complete